MRSGEGSGAPSSAAAAFENAVAAFRSGLDHVADDVTIEDVPPPKRLAPHASAIVATAHRDGDEVATGRLVLLFDPDGNDSWCGMFRLVAYVQADIEPEVAADPLLGEVGWTWFTEALDTYTPGYAAESGTVTRVITEGFGAKEEDLPLTGFELRASWSPEGADLAELDLGGHVLAWYACLRMAAGLEPPGTHAIHGASGESRPLDPARQRGQRHR
ncbi:MAG TPA: DUF3000 family protein [Streptosporangiaceae bacterium]|jgi:hypothetical protein